MNSLAAMDRANYQAVSYQQSVSNSTFRLRLSLGLVVVDVLAICMASLLVGFAMFGSAWQPGHAFFIGFIGAFLPVYLVCAHMVSAYSGPSVLDRQEAILRSGGGFAIAAVVAILAAASLNASILSSIQTLGLMAGVAGLFLTAGRYAYMTRSVQNLKGPLYSVIELRDGVMASHSGGAPSFDTSSFFDPASPTPESLDRLATLIGAIDRVIVKCPSKRRRAWIHILQGMNVHCEIVISSIGETRPIAIGSYQGQTTLVVARGPLSVRERLIKRMFDIAFSLAALVVLAPLLLLVALAIKIDSPGPIIFKQSRIGRQNKLFHVSKFRSMYSDRCDASGTRSTGKDDDRITRVGRIIRKLSIDELPQLWDVLAGKMSVVGPRPHAVSSMAEDRLFWEIDNRYWHRHACKPGLTGLAQIRGYRGSTQRISDLTDRLAADMEYLSQWSFWRDLGIVVQTVKVVWHRNAY